MKKTTAITKNARNIAFSAGLYLLGIILGWVFIGLWLTETPADLVAFCVGVH